MALPNYQGFMRPVLEVLAGGQEWRFAALREAVANNMGLTSADRTEMLPSGKQRTYDNRIGWAKTYLVKAGLVSNPRRGIVQITQVGQDALASGEEIDTEYLGRYERFKAFRDAGRGDDSATPTTVVAEKEAEETPDEQLENLYRSMRDALAAELLDLVRGAPPEFFERLVVSLLVRMGYGGSVKDAGKAIGRSGDNGIDGTIKQDRLGLDNVYIQAKRYQEGRAVGAGEVRDLAGALQVRRAIKGVLITTSSFSSGARDTARQIGNIVLVDGEELADLMIEHNIGVTTTSTYELKRVDSDFFDEE